MQRLELTDPAAAPEEAAAIVAALAQFMRATAPAPPARTAAEQDPWRRTALLEGVSRGQQRGDLRHPWINT